MFRKLIPLIIIIALVFVLMVGCESFSYGPIEGGDGDALVTGNGGLAVKQGDYLYFINGYTNYDPEDPKTNYFGNVLKGAIMRGVLTEDGELQNIDVVVPKKIFSSSVNTGIYVYGEWIYYVSPSTGTDNKGNVITDFIDFYRTSIDGTKTENITRIKGNNTKFKFTQDALIYYLDNELVSIDLTTSKFKESVIDEEVTAIIFPDKPVYDPANPKSQADYVFYTKASESDIDYNNVVYTVNADGSNKKIIIDKNTYTNNPDNINDIFTIKLLDSTFTDNKLTLYYTKTTVASVANTAKGVFGHQFDSLDINFNLDNEVQYSITNPTSIYPISYDEGVFLINSEQDSSGNSTSTEVTLVAPMADDDIVPNSRVYDFKSGVKILGIEEINGKDYIIYYLDNKIQIFPVDESENASIIMSAAIKTDWAKPVFIDNYMFYILDDEFKYTHMVVLNSFDVTDEDALINEMIGEMTQEDIDAKEEAEEE